MNKTFILLTSLLLSTSVFSMDSPTIDDFVNEEGWAKYQNKKKQLSKEFKVEQRLTLEPLRFELEKKHVEKIMLPAIRQIVGHDHPYYQSYDSLINNSSTGYSPGMNPNDYWNSWLKIPKYRQIVDEKNLEIKVTSPYFVTDLKNLQHNKWADEIVSQIKIEVLSLADENNELKHDNVELLDMYYSCQGHIERQNKRTEIIDDAKDSHIKYLEETIRDKNNVIEKISDGVFTKEEIDLDIIKNDYKKERAELIDSYHKEEKTEKNILLGKMSLIERFLNDRQEKSKIVKYYLKNKKYKTRGRYVVYHLDKLDDENKKLLEKIDDQVKIIHDQKEKIKFFSSKVIGEKTYFNEIKIRYKEDVAFFSKKEYQKNDSDFQNKFHPHKAAKNLADRFLESYKFNVENGQQKLDVVNYYLKNKLYKAWSSMIQNVLSNHITKSENYYKDQFNNLRDQALRNQDKGKLKLQASLALNDCLADLAIYDNGNDILNDSLDYDDFKNKANIIFDPFLKAVEKINSEEEETKIQDDINEAG